MQQKFASPAVKYHQKGFPPAPTPRVRRSEQTSQTLTGLLRLYFMMGISLAEHLEHSSRPQCLQWCFLVVRPNLFRHSSQQSPSPQRGSCDRMSSSLKSSCLVATGWLKIFTPALFSVPRMAPFFTSARHTSPDPLTYASKSGVF